ncbi:TRAP transporter substrate-binding protein [Arthrobacter sp. AB6]|uniref:TRAP transporter substrate-binding protein n=1 Tax=Arthrobacter sp. AB6 TaxID=2962570 RepID=UPI002882344F|nr:TRAP transporter substrate-binding protein [Arthrobacter sp. AB6]MDT0196759.1 TRAP transporter substrate-binding protein [Arthrobacter sp. AB6]
MSTVTNPRARRMVLAGAVLSSAALALTACSSGSQGGSEGPVKLSFAHTVEVKHPVNRCGAEIFKESVEKASDGNITIEIFPAGQLGTEAAQSDSAIAGDVDITQPSAGHLSEYYEPLSVLNAAFLFDSYSSMLEVARGDAGQELWKGLEDKTGLVVLDIYPQGIRQVTTKGVEVRKPEDLSGVSMRAADAPIWITNVSALGATPTPMALGEVYTGLQQGVIDAQENPVNLVASNSFDEVQDHVSLTNHVVQGNPLVINGDRWAGLSEEQQNILKDAAKESSASLQKCLEDDFTTIVQEWKDKGTMKVTEDVDIDAFRKHAEPVLMKEFGDVWGDQYKKIRDAQG